MKESEQQWTKCEQVTALKSHFSRMDDVDLLDRLQALYADLSAVLARRASVAALLAVENPCGACNKCCTSSGRVRQRVTDLELGLLERETGKTRADTFRAYLEQRGASTCPYYDLERHGCGAYQARPFSCRVFGHYRLEGTALPADCAFEGTEHPFAANRYAVDVPFARRLVELDFEYQCARPGPPAAASPNLGGEPPPEGVERALYHALRGEADEAEAAFAGASVSAYALYSWGLFLAERGRHAQAAERFAQALSLEPANAQYALQLGTTLLHCGRVMEAYQRLEQAAELAPWMAHPCAMLGHLELAVSRPWLAVERFEEAVRRDPGLSAYRDALAEARRRCDADL